MCVLLGCLIDALPPQAVTAAWHLFDFIYIAHYRSHDGDMLEYLEAALDGFHENKEIFQTLADQHGCASRHEATWLEEKHAKYVDSLFNFPRCMHFSTTFNVSSRMVRATIIIQRHPRACTVTP